MGFKSSPLIYLTQCTSMIKKNHTSLHPWCRTLLAILIVAQIVKDLPALYGRLRIYYRVHKTPLLWPNLSHLKPPHILTSYLFNINFPVCLSCCLLSSFSEPELMLLCDCQSVRKSVLAMSPSGTHDQILALVKTCAVLFSWGVLPDGMTGLSFYRSQILSFGKICTFTF
jgi:hypothetical protein